MKAAVFTMSADARCQICGLSWSTSDRWEQIEPEAVLRRARQHAYRTGHYVEAFDTKRHVYGGEEER